MRFFVLLLFLTLLKYVNNIFEYRENGRRAAMCIASIHNPGKQGVVVMGTTGI